MASSKKQSGLIGSGPKPINNLGSRNDTAKRHSTSTPTKTAAQRKAERHKANGSDSTLLLDSSGPAPRDSYGGRKRLDSLATTVRPSHKSVWGDRDERAEPSLGYYMSRSKKSSDPSFSIKTLATGETHNLDDSGIFSDEEFNDLELDRKAILHITEFGKGTDLSKYLKLEVPVEAVVFGRSVDTINTDYGNQITLTLKMKEGGIEINQKRQKLVLKVEEVSKVKYATRAVHMEFKSSFSWSTARHNSLQLKLSEKNTAKFVAAWSGHCRQEGFPDLLEEMSSPDIDRLIRPPAAFAKKSMTSLQKMQKSNPRTPLTAKHVIPLRNSMNNDNPTPPMNFYSPSAAIGDFPSSSAIDTPLARTRLTRSSTKGELTELIDIDEVTPPRIKKKEEPLPPFIPSLKYSFKDSSFAITDADFKCLGNKQWVNDTLIDFFMKFLTSEAVKNGKLNENECHAFSTFFFTKLTSTKNYYENIRRWLSKIDLMNKKFAIIPINESLHWYGCIIYNINGLLKEDETCTVYVFDSLTQKHSDVLPPIRQFLLEYFKEKCDLDIDPQRIMYKVGRVWKQPNFNDCGVHVIHNVSVFLEERQKSLELWSKDRVKDDDLRSVFKKDHKNNWRRELRETLLGLQEDMMRAEGYVPKEDEPVPANDDQAEDDDDLVYIDPAEFNLTEKSKSNSKNDTRSSSNIGSKEGSADPDDNKPSGDTTEMKSKSRFTSPSLENQESLDRKAGTIEPGLNQVLEEEKEESGSPDTNQGVNDASVIIEELATKLGRLGTQPEHGEIEFVENEDEHGQGNDHPIPASSDQRGIEIAYNDTDIKSASVSKSASESDENVNASTVMNAIELSDTEVTQSKQPVTPVIQVKASQDEEQPTSTRKKYLFDTTKDTVLDVSDSSESHSNDEEQPTNESKGITSEKVGTDELEKRKKRVSPAANGKKRKQIDMLISDEGIDLTTEESLSPVKVARKGLSVSEVMTNPRSPALSRRFTQGSDYLTIPSDHDSDTIPEGSEKDNEDGAVKRKRINKENFGYQEPSAYKQRAAKRSTDESVTEEEDGDVVEISEVDEDPDKPNRFSISIPRLKISSRHSSPTRASSSSSSSPAVSHRQKKKKIRKNRR